MQWFFYRRRFKTNEGVIVIGATNFPEALDKYVYVPLFLSFFEQISRDNLPIYNHLFNSFISSGQLLGYVYP